MCTEKKFTGDAHTIMQKLISQFKLSHIFYAKLMRIFHFNRKSLSKYGMQKIHGDENNENKLHNREDSLT